MSNIIYYFQFNCINAPGGKKAEIFINEMKASATNITRKTFLKYVDKKGLKELELELGYSSNHKKGLVMSKDFTVSYWKGVYRGYSCYYFCYSGIEYMFLWWVNSEKELSCKSFEDCVDLMIAV